MQVINCFKEDNPVINKKLKEVSIDEGLDIAKNLFNVLNERKDGIGLAANQVGIDASVAVTIIPSWAVIDKSRPNVWAMNTAAIAW